MFNLSVNGFFPVLLGSLFFYLKINYLFSICFVQKKKRKEAEMLRQQEEERLGRAMAADKAKREAEKLHKVRKALHF